MKSRERRLAKLEQQAHTRRAEVQVFAHGPEAMRLWRAGRLHEAVAAGIAWRASEANGAPA